MVHLLYVCWCCLGVFQPIQLKDKNTWDSDLFYSSVHIRPWDKLRLPLVDNFKPMVHLLYVCWCCLGVFQPIQLKDKNAWDSDLFYSSFHIRPWDKLRLPLVDTFKPMVHLLYVCWCCLGVFQPIQLKDKNTWDSDLFYSSVHIRPWDKLRLPLVDTFKPMVHLLYVCWCCLGVFQPIQLKDKNAWDSDLFYSSFLIRPWDKLSLPLVDTFKPMVHLLYGCWCCLGVFQPIQLTDKNAWDSDLFYSSFHIRPWDKLRLPLIDTFKPMVHLLYVCWCCLGVFQPIQLKDKNAWDSDLFYSSFHIRPWDKLRLPLVDTFKPMVHLLYVCWCCLGVFQPIQLKDKNTWDSDLFYSSVHIRPWDKLRLPLVDTFKPMVHLLYVCWCCLGVFQPIQLKDKNAWDSDLFYSSFHIRPWDKLRLPLVDTFKPMVHLLYVCWCCLWVFQPIQLKDKNAWDSDLFYSSFHIRPWDKLRLPLVDTFKPMVHLLYVCWCCLGVFQPIQLKDKNTWDSDLFYSSVHIRPWDKLRLPLVDTFKPMVHLLYVCWCCLWVFQPIQLKDKNAWDSDLFYSSFHIRPWDKLRLPLVDTFRPMVHLLYVCWCCLGVFQPIQLKDKNAWDSDLFYSSFHIRPWDKLRLPLVDTFKPMVHLLYVCWCCLWVFQPIQLKDKNAWDSDLFYSSFHIRPWDKLRLPLVDTFKPMVHLLYVCWCCLWVFQPIQLKDKNAWDSDLFYSSFHIRPYDKLRLTLVDTFKPMVHLLYVCWCCLGVFQPIQLKDKNAWDSDLFYSSFHIRPWDKLRLPLVDTFKPMVHLLYVCWCCLWVFQPIQLKDKNAWDSDLFYSSFHIRPWDKLRLPLVDTFRPMVHLLYVCWCYLGVFQPIQLKDKNAWDSDLFYSSFHIRP